MPAESQTGSPRRKRLGRHRRRVRADRPGKTRLIRAFQRDGGAQYSCESERVAKLGLVTAVSPLAFTQAIHMVRRKGTVVLVGLPPGEFPTPIFDVVLGRITIRGSIVGGRQDLAEAIEFAAEGKIRRHIHKMRLEDINDVFARMKAGQIDGRMVMTF